MEEMKNVYQSLTNIMRDWVKHMYFSVTFVKKNGDGRVMKCQLSPQSWKGNPTTNGMGLTWNPTERGFLVVWDVNSEGWRMVNFHTIQKITFGKKDYHFQNFNHFLNFMILQGNLQRIKLEEKKQGRELVEV